MEYSKDVKDAIAHVRANVDMYDVKHAILTIGIKKCPLFQVDYELDNQICDLMEEYGENNDLPEGWWMSEIDEDTILFEL
jgi:hypothetical protein